MIISRVLNLFKKVHASIRSNVFHYTIKFRFQNVNIVKPVKFSRGVYVSVTDLARLTIKKSAAFDRFSTILVRRGQLQIGQNCYIGIGSIICARDSISIGDNVLIAEYVTIRDQDHAVEFGKITADNGFETAPIVIGNNVWIGAKATITKGVTIGDNSVIGANSVVTANIPSNVVAAGVPARIIRQLAPDEARQSN